MVKLGPVAVGLLARASYAALIPRDYPSDDALSACPGYKATNVKTTATGLTADLSLAGKACNVYGTDLDHLTLQVTYETGMQTKSQDPCWLSLWPASSPRPSLANCCECRRPHPR